MPHLALIITLAVLLFIVLFLLLFLFAKLKVSVVVNNSDVKAYVGAIKVYDSKKKKKQKTVNIKKKKEEEFEKNYRSIKMIVNFIRRVFDDKNDDILYILRHIKRTFDVKRLDVALDYGFGDAAVTGIMGGGIWLVLSNAAAFVSKYIDVNDILNIAVKPHYTEKIIEFKVNFVFTVRVYHLIHTLRHILRFTKTLKGGR